MSCLPCLMMLGNEEGMGVMAEETVADKAKAVSSAIADVVGSVGALVSGKQITVKKEAGPGGQILVKRDYTPYYIIGGAILAAAGVGGYYLLRRRRRLAMNPRHGRKGRRPRTQYGQFKIYGSSVPGKRRALAKRALRRGDYPPTPKVSRRRRLSKRVLAARRRAMSRKAPRGKKGAVLRAWRRAHRANPRRGLKRPYSYAKRHKLLPKLGTGGRFALLAEELRRKKGIRHPERLAAWIGRGKHGRKKFAKLGRVGRKRARGGRRARVYRIAANRGRRSA